MLIPAIVLVELAMIKDLKRTVTGPETPGPVALLATRRSAWTLAMPMPGMATCCTAAWGYRPCSS